MASEHSVRTRSQGASGAVPDPSASSGAVPSRGDRIEFLRRFGLFVRGTVSSADERQIRVSLDDGGTASLIPGRDHYWIV
jgi:hypothetical protein